MAKLQTLKSTLPMLDTWRVQTIAAGSWRTSDQSSAQRGYGYRWQKARASEAGVDWILFLRQIPEKSSCLCLWQHPRSTLWKTYL